MRKVLAVLTSTAALAACNLGGTSSPAPAASTPAPAGANSQAAPCTSLGIENPAAIASAALMPKLVKLDIYWSNGTSQAEGLCSGSLITPSVVITAAHCTRNYEANPPFTPQANTSFYIGPGFSTAIPIYSVTEGVGWHESSATDMGLYRLQKPVQFPAGVTPFPLPTSCLSSYPSFTIAGRMFNSQDSSQAQFQLSPTESSAHVGTDSHANGTYILDSQGVLDPGDSGGPWFDNNNQLIAVTSAAGGAGGDDGTRLCDVLPEIMQVLQTWNEVGNLVTARGSGSTPSTGVVSGSGTAASLNSTASNNTISSAPSLATPAVPATVPSPAPATSPCTATSQKAP